MADLGQNPRGAEQAVVLGAGYYRVALLLSGAGVVLRCCLLVRAFFVSLDK